MDTNPITDIKDIPFASMLGEPVLACIRAQEEAARATQRYLQTVTAKTNVKGEQEAVCIVFRYQNADQMMELTLPLMTLVPIPYFAVDTLDIEFDAIVNEVSKDKLLCSYANVLSGCSTSLDQNRTEEREMNTQRHLSVRLHASQDNMPVGLSRLLHYLDESIALQAPPAPRQRVELWLSHHSVDLYQRATLVLTAIEDIPSDAVRWTSSDPRVASIDADGTITTHAPGRAIIFAETYDGLGRCIVNVLKGVAPTPKPHKPGKRPKPRPSKPSKPHKPSKPPKSSKSSKSSKASKSSKHAKSSPLAKPSRSTKAPRSSGLSAEPVRKASTKPIASQTSTPHKTQRQTRGKHS